MTDAKTNNSMLGYAVSRTNQKFKIEVTTGGGAFQVDHLFVSTTPIVDQTFKGDVFIDAPEVHRITVEGSLFLVVKPETVLSGIRTTLDLTHLVSEGVKLTLHNNSVGGNIIADGVHLTVRFTILRNSPFD